MTEQEYLKKKPELDRQYKLIDDKMDELGFSEYHDGSGDFGKRRLGNIVIWIMDMVPEYWDNEYPDNQFLFRGKTNKQDKWITSAEDLVDLIKAVRE